LVSSHQIGQSYATDAANMGITKVSVLYLKGLLLADIVRSLRTTAVKIDPNKGHPHLQAQIKINKILHSRKSI
ncbi:hypothetical protein, partial [Enterobacter cloacae complex sp. 4DZ1-17B1]|uniref:hypothetical protein n=1 Tax=Enterobacter cloacae complex sp. 4DZ1-17B1 TaxID=2511991 RepID=UPI002104E2A3